MPQPVEFSPGEPIAIYIIVKGGTPDQQSLPTITGKIAKISHNGKVTIEVNTGNGHIRQIVFDKTDFSQPTGIENFLPGHANKNIFLDARSTHRNLLKIAAHLQAIGKVDDYLTTYRTEASDDWKRNISIKPGFELGKFYTRQTSDSTQYIWPLVKLSNGASSAIEAEVIGRSVKAKKISTNHYVTNQWTLIESPPPKVLDKMKAKANDLGLSLA